MFDKERYPSSTHEFPLKFKGKKMLEGNQFFDFDHEKRWLQVDS